MQGLFAFVMSGLVIPEIDGPPSLGSAEIGARVCEQMRGTVGAVVGRTVVIRPWSLCVCVRLI